MCTPLHEAIEILKDLRESCHDQADTDIRVLLDRVIHLLEEADQQERLQPTARLAIIRDLGSVARSLPSLQALIEQLFG